MTTTDRPLQAGEVGRQLVFTDVQVDLTGASANLLLKRPEEAAELFATLPLVPAGRQLSRQTLASDFPVPGTYVYQVHVTWPTGPDYRGKQQRLTVLGNLEPEPVP